MVELYAKNVILKITGKGVKLMENSNISQGLADIIESKAVSPQITQNLNIYKVENGFVITVGCKIFVAKTWEEASQGIGEYWENPQEAEKKYTSKE